MKFLVLLMMFSQTLLSYPFIAEYPQGPDAVLTPGSLCDRPDEYRYRERIPYCSRDVDTRIKEDVFREYRQNGFRLDPRKRRDYKVDHLIPLCAGGSNRENNLWPQHVSIYTKTDPLESIGCEKLKAGRIKQQKLVQMILDAKRNLRLVPQTLRALQRL